MKTNRIRKFLPVGKQEILYDKHDPQRRESAIRDVRRWLGRKGFENLVEVIESGRYNPKWIANAMGILQGIEGYPVRAMIQRYHPVSIRLYGVDCHGKNVVPIRRPR